MKGYTFVGNGVCKSANNRFYPWVQYYGVYTAKECADKCKCIDNGSVTFRGFGLSGYYGSCDCFVDSPASAELPPFLNPPCNANEYLPFPANTGSGPIMTSSSDTCDESYNCYKVGGGDSKASKSPKAPKRG